MNSMYSPSNPTASMRGCPSSKQSGNAIDTQPDAGVGEGVSTFTSLGVIAVFVIIMVFVAGYVFTREATKPF